MGISRFFYTARYLKPVQVYGRVWFRFYKPKLKLCPPPQTRNITEVWQAPIKKANSLVSDFCFRFLNEEHQLCGAEDWNNPLWEKLWLYNLHYFDFLNASDAESRTIHHRELIDKWINENQLGQGNGWEPYPSSLRIVNWVKWSLSGNSLSDDARQSLAVQVRFLLKRLEVHLLGNHLFANAKALVFAGLFFGGDEAELWLNKGLKILGREIAEQILADGGHFERSPMYHAIILEDLFDLINVSRTYGRTVPNSWISTVKKMLVWLHGLSHPDGQISFFNDSAFAIAPSFLELKKYAERLDIACCELLNSCTDLIQFEQSGYLRWQDKDAVAVIDVAQVGPDYLPGHAHADTLSFELSLYGQRLFVNSGTSCYGVSEERLRQRSTSAHNTIEVDDENSSEVWGGFRVARRARPFNLTVQKQESITSVTCSHDGFRRLPGKVIHRRKWDFSSDCLTINDQLLGDYNSAKSRLYIHPEVIAEMVGDNNVSFQLSGGEKIYLEISGVSSVGLEPSTWYPEFGVSVPNVCLVAEISAQELLTTIKW